MKLSFPKNKGVRGKTPFFLQGQFCTPHSNYLNQPLKTPFGIKIMRFDHSTFK